MFSILKTFKKVTLELELEELEQEEIESLLQFFQDLKRHLILRKPHTKPDKETRKIMATTQATDDQEITLIYSLADSDSVPVEASAGTVAVVVQDADGGDLSQWIDVQQDAENPLKFAFRRKPSDGTQPQDLAFIAVGSAVVAGKPATESQDMLFTPGKAATLTASVSVTDVSDDELPAGEKTPVGSGDTASAAAGTGDASAAGTGDGSSAANLDAGGLAV